MEENKRTKWLLTAAALLLLGGLALFLWRTGFFALRSLEEAQAYMERFAPYSHLIYVLVQLSSVILAPIPSNIIAAAGGLLFGTLTAFLLTSAAVLSGSVIVFLLARLLGRSFADRLVSKRLSGKYLALIQSKRDVFLALVFLFPFFPDDLICILAGLTDISLPRFFIICLLTRPWGLLAACALGGSSLSLPLWLMVVLGAAGVCVFLLGLKYGDKVEKAILDRFKKPKD
ncbi:MAG: TVP38/TMEM64 family protein [Oscillospiraceae bacterium]|nr:TVP38/TMEM64 family protein [Oscillospiraceae bacterium]